MIRRFVFSGMALLSGCASYTPLPLGEVPAVLAPPVAAVLVRDMQGSMPSAPMPATIDLALPLDANAIATIAVIANPDLKALRLRADVADAQAFAAGLLPDPTFSLSADTVIAGPDTMLSVANAVGLDLNALRTHKAVVAQARAAARQVRLDLAWSEWQTAGQARIQAVRILALERNLDLARISRDASQYLLDRTLRAAIRKDLSADAVQAARTAAFDAAERWRTGDQDLTTARFELSKLLGLPPATALRIAPSPLADVPPGADRLFAIARSHRADLAALQAGYAAQEASVHKAVLDQFPSLNLTLNSSRDSTGNTLFGPSVDFTLPLWNRNRGGIAIERATRAALKGEYEARLFQARADIAAAVAGIMTVRLQRERILHDLPALSRFAQGSRNAAARGDIAPAISETAEQVMRDKQIQLAQAEQAIAEQTIALELLTGVPKEAWFR